MNKIMKKLEDSLSDESRHTVRLYNRSLITKLKLYKETNTKNISILESPKSGKELDGYSESMLSLSPNQLKCLAIFVNELDKNPNARLDIFLRNMESLIIKESKKTNNKAGKKGAYYENKADFTNFIRLYKNGDDYLYHELLHMATYRFDEKLNTDFSGLLQIKYGKKSFSLGEGLSEGYTEVLTRRYFSKYVEHFEVVYDIFTNIASLLEKIVGKDEMERCYFNNNLKSLVENLEKYAKKERIIEVLKELDALFVMYDQNQSYIKTVIADKLYTDIVINLLEWYVHKMCLEKNDKAHELISDYILDIVVHSEPYLENKIIEKGDTLRKHFGF